MNTQRADPDRTEDAPPPDAGRRAVLTGLLALAGACVGCARGMSGSAAERPAPTEASKSAPATAGEPLKTERSRIIHLMNRATFGATVSETDGATRQGRESWLAEQLAPPAGPEPAVDRLLEKFYFYHRTPRELLDHVYEMSLGRRKEFAPFSQDLLYAPILTRQLLSQRILRAVKSHWQLREVLIDFWTNHFNTSMDKTAVTIYGMYDFERTAVAPHALGKFRTLLGAVAHHPVLIDFLDNNQSNARDPEGLNENYGREMLELYTVGVEAGYTQDDVINSARAFSGWSLAFPHNPAGKKIEDFYYHYTYDAARHDPNEKKIMTLTLPAGGGEQDGERLLDMVARHPATAKHIARKLVIRLVNDAPPADIVDHAAKTFLDTDGDLAAVVKSILTHDSFYSSANVKSKVKTMLEFIASMLRTWPCPRAIQALSGPQDAHARDMVEPGKPQDLRFTMVDSLKTDHIPYRWSAAAGWRDNASTWTTSTQIRNRITLAAQLVTEQPPTETTTAAFMPRLQKQVFLGEASDATLNDLRRQASPAQALATAMMSPDFQHR